MGVPETHRALNDHGKSVKNSKILVLGIAYKKNVDDMRESPAVELMEMLREKGATVAYSDPHVPTFPKIRKSHFDLSSVPLTDETLRAYDAVLLVTNHDAFDYDLIAQEATLIVDTRGVYREPPPTSSAPENKADVPSFSTAKKPLSNSGLDKPLLPP